MQRLRIVIEIDTTKARDQFNAAVLAKVSGMSDLGNTVYLATEIAPQHSIRARKIMIEQD